MPHSFADIPHGIRRRVTGGERVALLRLDALGRGQHGGLEPAETDTYIAGVRDPEIIR